MASKASSAAIALLLCLVVNADFDIDNCKIAFKQNAHEVAESLYLIDLSIKNTTHGLATTYFPDTQYDIIIRPKSTTLAFKEFHFRMINVNRSMSYGALELRDPDYSTFDSNDYCMDRVINLATPNKPNITIGWQSPPTKSGCIKLKAYIKETENRYHTANLTVCEDPRVELDNPGEILRNCCACELAKYEMTFEGMWSKYTHPRGFPRKEYLASFPTVVGAAHDAHYKIWQVYANASEGLKTFAETGYTVPLELELKAHRDNITTLIKFRGTNFKNHTLARAQLRVDRKNHVISLVGRINPSPDWFIGVSSLELCKTDCTWMENKTLNLYAYDAGSRTGLNFFDENNGYTHDVINAMNTSWPEPVGNVTPPFYDKFNNTHEVRPMAQIHLRRIRTYGSTCIEVKNESIPEHCVSEWTELQCSVTCGYGVKVFKRNYLDGYNATNCPAKVERREKCGDSQVKCEEPINEETCQFEEWSEWSKCTKSCGQETAHRSRRYKIEPDKCQQKFPGNPLIEYKDCGHPPCPKDERLCEDSLYEAWSTWSSCSVTVGSGLRYRHRKLLRETTTKDFPDSGYFTCLYDKQVCKGVDPATITEAPLPDPDPIPFVKYSEDHHPVAPTKPSECLFPLDEGHKCKDNSDEMSYKWAYNKDANRCEVFGYLGCGGNDNRFDDEADCHSTCTLDGEVIECQMSEWSKWSICASCQADAIRTRYVKVEPSPSAKPCPVANRVETRPCRLFMKGCELN